MKIYNSQYFLIGIFVLIIILAIIFLILLLSGGKKKSKKEKAQERQMQENQINNNINNDLQTAGNIMPNNNEANITDANSMDNILITPDMQPQAPEVNQVAPESISQNMNVNQEQVAPNIFESTPVDIPSTPVMDVPDVNPLDLEKPIETPVSQPVSPVIPDVNPINNVVEPVSVNTNDINPVNNNISVNIPDVNSTQNAPVEKPAEVGVKLPSIDDLLNQANAATNNTVKESPNQFSSVYVNNQNNSVDLPKLNDENK